MSKAKVTRDIEGMATAVITAYVKYINEHREMDNLSVVTASAWYLAAVVDALSLNENDLSQKEVVTLIADAAMIMLEDASTVREHMATILKSVVGEVH
jgi:hypothetical protein